MPPQFDGNNLPRALTRLLLEWQHGISSDSGAATDAASSSLFIYHSFLTNRLILKSIPLLSAPEGFREPTVEPCMKTRTLLGLVAVVAVAGFTASAQAGWSVGVCFAAPVHYAPRVVVTAPYYAPPVAYYPPPVVHCAPPVRYYPPQVVYVAPRYERHYGYADYRGHNRDRRGHDSRGHSRGGHR